MTKAYTNEKSGEFHRFFRLKGLCSELITNPFNG